MERSLLSYVGLQMSVEKSKWNGESYILDLFFFSLSHFSKDLKPLIRGDWVPYL